MEIEKVARIVAAAIALATIAILIAKHILFPTTRYMDDLPIALILCYGIGRLLFVSRKKQNTNK